MDETILRVPFEDGYIGCRCPRDECRGFFKQMLGTGIENNPQCHCPYCGHMDEGSAFLDPDAMKYITSFATRHIYSQLHDLLKQHEFSIEPSGPFGIGISMTVSGTPPTVRLYRAQEFETVVICSHCTLQYAIYGVFAYCPDCGIHNSYQILEKNLELAQKEAALGVAAEIDAELATRLIEDALENEISSFDGFGRKTCSIHATKATAPDKVESISFQNLIGAQKRLRELFRFDLAAAVSSYEWEFACQCFQKRRLLAHRMGVIDEEYVRLASDPQAVPGHKVHISASEVTSLGSILSQLGAYLIQQLGALGSTSPLSPGGPIS